MAVWIQIIGLRKLSSIKREKELLSKILTRTEFDLEFVENKTGAELNEIRWSLNQSKGIELFELPIHDQYLRVYFDNPNFIEFSGSFDLFSSWFRFVDKEQSEITGGIRKVFRKIASEYGMSELIYFSETFFSLDEIRTQEESFEALKKRLNDGEEYRKTAFFGLEPNQYYLEKINSETSNLN